MVTLNICKTEYTTINEVDKEAIWLQKILKELGLINYSFSLTIIYEDNLSTIAFIKNPEFYRQTK